MTKRDSAQVVTCPDCDRPLSQDKRGIFCDGCGARLYLIDAAGPHSPERIREAVTGRQWGAAVRPLKKTRIR